jgi:hypothetical protein
VWRLVEQYSRQRLKKTWIKSTPNKRVTIGDSYQSSKCVNNCNPPLARGIERLNPPARVIGRLWSDNRAYLRPLAQPTPNVEERPSDDERSRRRQRLIHRAELIAGIIMIIRSLRCLPVLKAHGSPPAFGSSRLRNQIHPSAYLRLLATHAYSFQWTPVTPSSR